MNTSRYRASTTSVGSLFQCLATLMVKKFFCNVQSETQLCDSLCYSMHPVIGYQGKDQHIAHSYQEETSLLSMPYFSRLGDPTDI